jgi:hypothetical protein
LPAGCFLRASKGILNKWTPSGNRTGYGTTAGISLATGRSRVQCFSLYFNYLRSTLLARGEKFAANAKVKQAVTSWLQTIDSSFFYAGIKNRCYGGALAGDCVEVWCVPSATHEPCVHGTA